MTLALGIVLVIVAADAPRAHAGDAVELKPAELLAAVRAPQLDLEAAVWLDQVEVPLGAARLDVDRGLLVPALVAGRPAELVFIGHARFRLDPGDEIEAGQLELFTGARALDAPVEEVVLAFGAEDEARRLLDRPRAGALRPDLVERVRTIHDRWLAGAERRTLGVAAGLFRARVGDGPYARFVALWCKSFELGELVYQLDPEDAEAMTLASFTPIDVSRWEERRLRRHIRTEQRKGRWLGLRVEDLGSWDVWSSMPWEPQSGEAFPGAVGFEARHYEIDARVLRDRMRLEGRARLHLEAIRSDRRVVTLELFRDLAPERVTDEHGRQLFFFREGNAMFVLLPEAHEAGSGLRLDVTWDGRVLSWVTGRVFDLADTGAWHPHCGTTDRATYDVTLRWPARYDLVAGGTLVEEGRDGRERWERRRLDTAAIAFSFALGEFVVDERIVGDTRLRVAFNRTLYPRLTPAVRRATLDTLTRALVFFEERFGPLPIRDLTVVTAPRRYSQSYLGFVTLADSALGATDPEALSSRWRRETTVAHELAHQWWGNLIGWSSYRDQWLSEAMANYAALMFAAQAGGAGEERADLLAAMSAGWRQSLAASTRDGHTLESLGPVVLGERLSSSKSPEAYRAIVYRKGAAVLAMLARAMGEERFLDMLRELAATRAHGVLTTETFLAAVESSSGLDIDGFARQFVYGTGIPQVYYEYDLAREEEGGGWRFVGEAAMQSDPRWLHRIVREEETGGFILVREPLVEPADGRRALMVPFVVTLEPDAAAEQGEAAREGHLFLEGWQDRFEIHTDAEPRELRLDPRGEILARFWSAERHPRRMLRHRAWERAQAGRADEAESHLLEALRLAPEPDDEPVAVNTPSEAIVPRDVRPFEEARIRLDLARLYIDQGRLDDARAVLAGANEVLEAVDRSAYELEREVLESSIALRAGDAPAAYERLRRTLRRLAGPGHTDWRSLSWRMRIDSERVALTEAWALLAIAAHELGETEAFEWAVEHAAARGVDVTAIAPRERPPAPAPHG